MAGVIFFTLLTLLLAIMLVLSNKILNRKELRIEKIHNMLPGYNCGACGFAGCKGMAEKILEDIKNLDKCKPIKEEQYKEIKEYFSKR